MFWTACGKPESGKFVKGKHVCIVIATLPLNGTSVTHTHFRISALHTKTKMAEDLKKI